MAVDVTGRYALITGRKSMVLVDLDGDTDGSVVSSMVQQHDFAATSKILPTKHTPVSKRMARNSKYEPTASKFNRHMADLFAITTCQVAEIFSIKDLNPMKPKLSLRGHSRAITDLDWSHSDPYLLGSSAADCLINLWDIRDNRRPSATMTSVSGATQIKFCKTSSNLIATSHEIDIRIWDIRQPNLPLYYIAAHLQKINGMDWNPNKTSCDHEQLITCSQDSTIKLWDLNSNKIKPSANLPTRTPAWRVAYTPVSANAILTSTLPQLRSRAECTALRLWSMKPNRFEQKKLELILGLVGHTDVVVDFDWRARPSSTDCEIVSWSKDQTLRVWRIDRQFIEMNVENSDFETECEPAEAPSVESSSFINNSASTTPGSVRDSASKSKRQDNSTADSVETPTRPLEFVKEESEFKEGDDIRDADEDLSEENSSSINELKQEFNLINKNIPNIEFEELNALRRVCLVTARAKNITCRLRIALPPTYPQNECPTFTIIDSNQYGCVSLNQESKEKLLQLLNETAKSQLSRSRNCLEPCLRKFIAALQKITSHSSHKKRLVGSGLDYKDDPITLSAQRDHSVPFPHTSGARFCGNLLVCFGRPLIPTSSAGGQTTNWSVETPRSMAQLSAQLDNMRRQGSYNLSNISISYFYYGAMRRAELQSRSGKNSASSNRSGSSKYLPSRSKSALHAQSIMSKSYKCGPVVVYDMSDLTGAVSGDLAESYVFDKDVIKMCRRNAEIASTYNRKDLVQIWSLAELSSEGVLNSYIPKKDDDNSFSMVNYDSDFGDRPWTMHPFGSKLIQSLIDHYVDNCHDVQTAAMLVWTFSTPRIGRSNRTQCMHISASLSKGANNHSFNNMGQNYHTAVPTMLTCTGDNKLGCSNVETLSDEWNFVNGPETHLYSNSWSNSTIHEHLAGSNPKTHKLTKPCDTTSQGDDVSQEDDSRFPKLNILSPERALQNDLIMHIYAEFLYRLNLLNQRAMVLKNVGSNSAYSEIFKTRHSSIEPPEERLPNLSLQCCNKNCRTKCRSAQCPNCKRFTLYCSICRLPARGSSSICMKCFHGGHVNHFNTWFNEYDFCPAGCGCKCLSADY